MAEQTKPPPRQDGPLSSGETLFERSVNAQYAMVEAVRSSNTLRNRAVFALARHQAEQIGLVWDQLPWHSQGVEQDQRYQIVGAAAAIDMLIRAGFIEAEIPPEAIEHQEASQAYGRSIGARWAE